MKQLEIQLNPIVETVRIEVKKEMPLEVYREWARWSMYAELMERTPDGKVIWDQNVTTIYAPKYFDAEYRAIQNDWIKVNLEVPKEWLL